MKLLKHHLTGHPRVDTERRGCCCPWNLGGGELSAINWSKLFYQRCRWHDAPLLRRKRDSAQWWLLACLDRDLKGWISVYRMVWVLLSVEFWRGRIECDQLIKIVISITPLTQYHIALRKCDSAQWWSLARLDRDLKGWMSVWTAGGSREMINNKESG